MWNYPVRFVRPSIVNDTPEAWAKLERDYRQLLRELREAVDCFGAERVERDLHAITKGRQGRTPDEDLNGQQLNRQLLEEYDLRAAEGEVNVSALARDFRNEHHLEVTIGAIRKRLERALDAREQQIREQAEFDRMIREPSIVGTSLAGSWTKKKI
jgi:hypothetical protein